MDRQSPSSFVWTVPSYRKHEASTVQTIPRIGQSPTSFVWTIPTLRKHQTEEVVQTILIKSPKSIVRTHPIGRQSPRSSV